MNLPNETKIRFCNAFYAMLCHCDKCLKCKEYLYEGDGDLCYDGKRILAKEMAYSETTPEQPHEPHNP